MSAVTLDTPLRQLMLLDKSVLNVLQKYGLGCASCLGAQFETLNEACLAHNLDGDMVVIEMNAALAACDTTNGEIK